MKTLFKLMPAALLLAACTTVPTGPSVMSLPGSGKSFDEFRADDAVCRQYALEQIGGATPGQTAVDSGVRSAVVGTAVGAAAGAALGGSRGAATGAGAGLIVGSMAGTGAADASAYGSQRRYDFAYQQCMYAKGNQVPIAGQVAPRRSYRPYGSYPPPPAAGSMPPPPPPGAPPPPPPDAYPR